MISSGSQNVTTVDVLRMAFYVIFCTVIAHTKVERNQGTGRLRMCVQKENPWTWEYDWIIRPSYPLDIYWIILIGYDNYKICRIVVCRPKDDCTCIERKVETYCSGIEGNDAEIWSHRYVIYRIRARKKTSSCYIGQSSLDIVSGICHIGSRVSVHGSFNGRGVSRQMKIPFNTGKEIFRQMLYYLSWRN